MKRHEFEIYKKVDEELMLFDFLEIKGLKKEYFKWRDTEFEEK